MNSETRSADRIADWLRALKLQDAAVILLETAGPFKILGAQLAYLLEPLFGGSDGLVRDFAVVLEKPEEYLRLLECLRAEEEKR
jgi:hypothetical protein